MANNWTYFIRDNDTGEVKIGQSTNPFERIKSVKSSDPNRNNLELIDIRPDHSLEKEMHSRFQHLRTTGEWFMPDEELDKLIEHPAELPIDFNDSPISEEAPIHPMTYVFIGVVFLVYAVMRWVLFIMAGIDSITYTSALVVSIVTIGSIAIIYEYSGYRIRVIFVKVTNGHKQREEVE